MKDTVSESAKIPVAVSDSFKYFNLVVTAFGNGNETKLAKYQLDPKSVHISADDQQYDGTEKTVDITVDNLTEGEDYRVIYDNNVEVGTATVTVKGINEYEGRYFSSFDIFDSGITTDGLIWTLAPSHVLTISGNTTMSDYGTDDDNLPPWQKHKDNIQRIVVEDGVKSIGDNAFNNCNALSEVVIPESVISIGNNSFDNCQQLKAVMYSGSEDEWNGLSIGSNNNSLQDASIFYDYSDNYLLGDADGNGEIEVTDTTFIQRFIAEIETPIPYTILIRGDVDGSGILEVMDATAIQYYLANIKNPYHIGEKVS